MDNWNPHLTGASGFVEPLLNHLRQDHPLETELVVSGGLAVICAMAFLKKLKAYLLHSGPAA